MVDDVPTRSDGLAGVFGAPVADSIDERRVLDGVLSSLFGEEPLPLHIDRYRVEARIGQGGLGVVYSAHDPVLGRRVAIKRLRGALPGSREEARLVREARALARVTHPNVVTVHDVGTEPSGPFVYLVTELIDGVDLARWLEQPRDSKDVLRVFIAAGRGLHAAHQAGLVHRDFKPGNVMLANDGRVCVLDFGLAQAGGEMQATRANRLDATPAGLDGITQAGTVIGTPRYMAPEQHTGGEVDARSDQFSFCLSLWIALYRASPYLPLGSDGVEAKRLGKIDPPAHADAPAWVEAVLREGLAPAPADRWPSMAALLERLERGQRRRARLGLGAAAVVALAVAAGVGAAFGAAERSPVDRPSEPRDPNIERHISAAMAEYQALDFAEARIALRRAAELDPADGVVRLYLADTLRWLDRPVAEIHNELALALASDDLSAAQIAFAKNLGLLVDHDYPAAITGFEVAVATDPDSTLLLYGLFESLVHGGRPGAALPIDRRIRELDPSFALHTFHVLEYCAAIDDVACVRGVHQDAARDELGTWEIWEARLLAREGRREEGIRLLQAWTNAHGPESFWASQELMMLLLRGQHDEELAAYASQPRFMRLPEYGLALLHADASSLDARLTDALAFTTNDGHGAGGHRGWLLLGAAIVAGAQRESILRWAVEYERERRLAQGSSARMAVLQLYVDEALGRPIAAVPDPTEPQFEAEAIVAAMAARRRGDVAGAIAKWREVVALAPDSALSGLALMEQAKAEASAGDHLAVIETCRRVLEPIKTSWTWAGTAGPCLRLRADAFASLGRSADARTDYRRILSLRRDAPAHDALAAAARAGLIELGSG